MHPRCCRPATSWVHFTTICNTQSSAPEDRREHRPKHVELNGIINRPLLLHLVGVYIVYVNDAGQTNIKVIYFTVHSPINKLGDERDSVSMNRTARL